MWLSKIEVRNILNIFAIEEEDVNTVEVWQNSVAALVELVGKKHHSPVTPLQSCGSVASKCFSVTHLISCTEHTIKEVYINDHMQGKRNKTYLITFVMCNEESLPRQKIGRILSEDINMTS